MKKSQQWWDCVEVSRKTFASSSAIISQLECTLIFESGLSIICARWAMAPASTTVCAN